MEVAGRDGGIQVREWEARTVVEGAIGGGGGGRGRGDDPGRVVGWFWAYAEGLNEAGRRRLLEWVTELDALPAHGVVMRIEVRADWGDAHLPYVSACFAKVMLPAYSCPAALEAGLAQALENHAGALEKGMAFTSI